MIMLTNVLRVFYDASIPFISARQHTYKEMIDAIIQTRTDYKGPSDRDISDSLVDEEFIKCEMRRNALLEDFALQGLLLTLQTDGATITRRPLTNYVTQIPNKDPLHLAYDNSSEFYHSGGSKDAKTVFEGIDNV
jgi:hypothetical protein